MNAATESVAPAPRVGVTTARVPRQGTTVGRRPRMTETVAPARSVLPRTEVKFRQHLIVEIPPMDVVLTGVPAVRQSVTVEIPAPTIDLVQRGGSVSQAITVEIPAPAVTIAQSMAVRQDVEVAIPSPEVSIEHSWKVDGPTILASDDFARSTGNLTTPWTRRVNFGSDNFAIDSSQRAYRTGSGSNDSSDGLDAYMHQTDLGSQDQYGRVLVRVFASGSSSPPGVVLRGIAPNSGQALFGQVWSSGWRILVSTPGGGSRTTLQSGTGSFTAGSNIEMQVRGGVVTLKYAGVELAVLSQPTIPAGTYGGFSAGQNANRVDDVNLGAYI